MQQGDYYSSVSYYYPQNPNPNPIDQHNHPNPSSATTYASAPPFTTNYSPSDYSAYPSAITYPPNTPYPQNPDLPLPPSPTAPSYAPTNPTLQSLNPSISAPSSSYDPQGPYQPPPPPPPPHQQHSSYYPPYDPQQTAPNYSSIPTNPNPSPTTNLNPPCSAVYPSPYGHIGSSVPPVRANSYESNVKLDQGWGYFDESSGGYAGYGRSSRSDVGSDLYGKRSDSGTSRFDSSAYRDDGFGYSDGVYAYQGSKVEPYGARGTEPKSSTWSGFDDFGRPISFPPRKDQTGSSPIVRAIPKADTQQDVKGGVQKYRVKLLPDGGSQGTTDVLCQIGLDGIRMLDPSTSRTLRIYPLETLTRCEVTDSSTFTFWSKSSVDIEPRRIRLQSNSYTTNTILDIVTAATVQLKEMGGRSKPSDSLKTTEQPTEKKKGIADWMNLMKPGNEEKDHWVPDEAVTKCTACATDFSAFVRKHHCRNCGDIFCDKCTHGRIALTADENAQPVRVCDRCMAEVTQRLSNAKESASKSAILQTHEDLAKKLQEEMEKNRKASSDSKSDGSGRRMKEVACPICTVHLQVQVPSSGSETIECGVCQHPFLVSAH
ncbi:protein FREE1 [Cornus florida]|uniref:protein FREE1 n=1 Tax=Cornus florida TaxID=4283 RepID=UPI00289C68A0|nr:protein FREE1 [Cornus florida]